MIDLREGAGLNAVVAIQRCFRGYQARRYYHQIKIGVVALQQCNPHYPIFLKNSYAIILIPDLNKEEVLKKYLILKGKELHVFHFPLKF